VTAHAVTLSGLASTTTYHYRVESKDAAGNLATSSDQTFTTAASLNHPPVLAPIGNQLVKVSKSLIFSVAATDPDGDPLIYTAVNLPPRAAFIGQTFSWTPDAGQAGTYQVTFAVSDGLLEDTELVTITVKQKAVLNKI